MAGASTESPRLAAMRDFCKRQGWEMHAWTGNQREPEEGISIRLGESPRAMALRSESHDGLDVAVARMEQALGALARAGSDVYLQEKHSQWGQI